MRKLFHFDSPAAPYRADATVLCCFDDRFQLAFRKFLRRIGVSRADVISVGGGANALADGAETQFVLDQMRTSLRLHASPRIVLFMHSDCMACGGLAVFQGNRAAEAAHHWQQLQHAAALARQLFPETAVECYFVDFDGVWSAEAELSAA